MSDFTLVIFPPSETTSFSLYHNLSFIVGLWKWNQTNLMEHCKPDTNVLERENYLSGITIDFLCCCSHGVVQLNCLLERTYEYNNITSPLLGALSAYLIYLKVSNCCCWFLAILRHFTQMSVEYPCSKTLHSQY